MEMKRFLKAIKINLYYPLKISICCNYLCIMLHNTLVRSIFDMQCSICPEWKDTVSLTCMMDNY